MACVLAIFLLVYVFLSCIPLLYLNAPYRTPLSGALWRLGNAISDFLVHKHDLRRDKTLNEAMLEKSLKDTTARDQQAMVYTIKSLTDKDEFLPFLEAISDVIYNPMGPNLLFRGPIHKQNLPLVMPLLQTSDSEVNVFVRIAQFTSSPWLDDRAAKACLRALWPLIYALVKPSFHTSRERERLYIGDDRYQGY
ncbi:hypothetical protein D9758_007132 [Tetrapyrgos nigripes]|uniref:Uncharacterized protein n=1 Tax=Tetrapyrgos nigripes TaxID=182062 RepID=A0A8H5LMU5_9AGAR|nr:hypothetical protein D9758_007132 [Tetrapyrgos nigripes]